MDYIDPLDKYTRDAEVFPAKSSFVNPRQSSNYNNEQNNLIAYSSRTRETIGMAGNSIIHANPRD